MKIKNDKNIVKEQREVVSEFYMSARRSQWQSSEGDAVSKWGNNASVTARFKGNKRYLDAASNISSAYIFHISPYISNGMHMLYPLHTRWFVSWIQAFLLNFADLNLASTYTILELGTPIFSLPKHSTHFHHINQLKKQVQSSNEYLIWVHLLDSVCITAKATHTDYIPGSSTWTKQNDQQ